MKKPLPASHGFCINVFTMENKTTNWAKLIRTSVSTCISALALVLGGLYVFHRGALDNMHLDEKAIGFLIAAAVPWVLERIESFKGFGFEFTQKLDEQRAVIDQQQELLNLMFWFSMEKDMFDTLKNLNADQEFKHDRANRDFYPIVNAQLKELFNRGYIDRGPNKISSNDDIGHGRIVTELGKRFVYERTILEAADGMKEFQRLFSGIGRKA